MSLRTEKGAKLLEFLKATATIRRTRVTSYNSGEKVLWFADVPKDRGECRSPFLTLKPEELPGLWLEVRKKRMPARPPVPQVVTDWVRADELDNPEKEPELRAEITVIVEQRVPDPDEPQDTRRTMVQQMPELRRLSDQPQVEEAWLEYLVEKWEPWAQEMSRWQDVQDIYESLDFMRRRLEEAEERYELVLAIGYLKWCDPTGTRVERHVLTASAELTFDAARGILSIVPSASFDTFRVELDMFELQHRPRLNQLELSERLEELDIHAWDFDLVAPLLREIANSLSADSQVDETFQRSDRIDEHPCLSFTPAIVLRERRPTAYEDLIQKLHKAATDGSLETTWPWDRLLCEGETANGGAGQSNGPPEHDPPGYSEENRFLFPLPTNEEQRQIVQRLRADPCVLVKGPPGTGKSHTIANLICHLLARGDRVLVTAHAPKALVVLRGLLPDDIRDLCVTALGSSHDDQRLLEESVRGILRRKNEWRGIEAAQLAIEEKEVELHKLGDELARVERDLRAFREAETYSHELPGGYSGTAAHIARRLAEQEQEFGWFPQLSADAAFPLDMSEIAFLTDAQADFTADARAELDLDIVDAELPGPDEFQALVARLIDAEQSVQRASRGTDSARLDILEPVGTEQLYRLREALEALTDLAARAGRVLGEIAETILNDLLAFAEARWIHHADDSEALLKDATHLLKVIGPARIELPDGIAEDHLRTDVERRLAHFEAGGRKGFFVIARRVVRETRYVIKDCRVDGKKVVEVGQLRYVRDFLELRRTVRRLQQLWDTSLAQESSQAVSQAEELTSELRQLLKFFSSDQAGLLATALRSNRPALASANDRDNWLKAIDALLASREAREAQHKLDRLLETITGSQNGTKAHPCLNALEDAVRRRDITAWRTAWQARERVRLAKELLARYDGLLEKLDEGCPDLANLLRSTGGDPIWRNRVNKLREAWHWASARAWLRRVSGTSAYWERVQKYHRLRQKIEKATEKLVSLRAWKAFFDRINEKTVQSLKAWTRAVDRIGKGTGKYAYRHRRTARQYLMECVPRIPAWVMPLHRLWDSVDAVPGLFDTVIVDEASQASIDALVLLLLSKRIIVVGDDKQNSPEAVGVLEDDIARLAREHLSSFRFRDEFRPDTSLFDHAERTFESHITLREHFRCVPEIIRFSNDLCYRDAPLIPLRQAPPDRLPPLRSRFVSEGACEGEGQRIQNSSEAEALVETIVKLVEDKAYEGKTMGVIVLQGHNQARLIEKKLAQRLDPKVIEERRLRCGGPATFQGDQRDVIFLSLVTAPSVNYRALSRLPDQRRFNVAMSRARDQVWLFHSVETHELSLDDLRRRLVSFFGSPQNAAVDALFEDLDRLEREAKRPRRLGAQPEPYESWFEVDVALDLLRRKYRVRPQVEVVAGYRIDLVVEGLDARIAVECDGDEWHGPDRYEQDMVRQRQLERAGWTFVRVGESDFYVNRQRAIDAVTETCEKMGIHSIDFIEEPQQEPARIPSDKAGGPMDVLPAPATTKEEDEEEGAAEAEVSSSSVGPFTGYSKNLGFPDPREASSANVREILLGIIERDGPLTRSSIYRLYVEACPALQRVGRVVQQALNRVLGAMLRASEIVQQDELGDRSPDGQVLRIADSPAVRVRPAGRRDLLEIPPSELFAVLRQLPQSELPLADGEASMHALLDHYGFRRLTKPRSAYLRKIVQIARRPEHGCAAEK